MMTTIDHLDVTENDDNNDDDDDDDEDDARADFRYDGIRDSRVNVDSGRLT